MNPRICLALLCTMFIFGCKPNTRVFTKDNITLWASLSEYDVYENKYHIKGIGNQDSLYDKNPPIFLKWENEMVINLSSVTSIESLCEDAIRVGDASANWPKGTKKVTIPPCILYILENDIVSIETAFINYPNAKVEISRNGTNYFPAPLSEGAVWKLFGKPDELNEVWIE